MQFRGRNHNTFLSFQVDVNYTFNCSLSKFGEIIMRKLGFSAKILMFVGLALFTLGLILLLHESTIFTFFLQVFPDALTTVAFGAVILLAGQALVVSAVVQLNSAKLLNSLQVERQLTMATIARNSEQYQTKMQDANLPGNCRYCGAKMKQSSFCPECGKANIN